MARKLKTYQTSLGFYDQAIAAPSMKAALEAWGAESNLFHQGVAKETTDPNVVAATMAKPGVVLRRPVGSDGPFAEHAALPTELGEAVHDRPRKRRVKAAKQPARKIEHSRAGSAALAFEKEQKRRERERRKEELAWAKERERRDKAAAKAQAALDDAREEHEANATALEAERSAVEQRAQAEEARWEKQKKKLQDALRRARQ
jgi:colicin import membrane protein